MALLILMISSTYHHHPPHQRLLPTAGRLRAPNIHMQNGVRRIVISFGPNEHFPRPSIDLFFAPFYPGGLIYIYMHHTDHATVQLPSAACTVSIHAC